jgi:hypothetical protein
MFMRVNSTCTTRCAHASVDDLSRRHSVGDPLRKSVFERMASEFVAGDRRFLLMSEGYRQFPLVLMDPAAGYPLENQQVLRKAFPSPPSAYAFASAHLECAVIQSCLFWIGVAELLVIMAVLLSSVPATACAVLAWRARAKSIRSSR